MRKNLLKLMWPLAAFACLMLAAGCSDTTTDTDDQPAADAGISDTDNDTGLDQVAPTDSGVEEDTDTGVDQGDQIPEIYEDGNSDLENSQEVTLPVRINGAIDPPVRAGSEFLPDFDSFKFHADAGQVLTIDVDTTGGRLTPIVIVQHYDQVGDPIYERIGGYIESGDGQIWREAFLPYTGDYVLYISDLAHFTDGPPVGGFNYHYTITLTIDDLDYTSTTLPIDDVGTIVNKGAVKAWKFFASEVADDELFRAAVAAERLREGSVLDTILILYDLTDDEVAAENDDFSSAHSDSRLDTELTAGHDYLLVLDSIIFDMFGDANYHVTAEFLDLYDEREPNDDYGDAAIITVPTAMPVLGTIGEPKVVNNSLTHDIDVFTFSAEKGDFFTFRVEPGEGAPTDPFLAIGALYNTWFGPQFVTTHLNNDSDGVGARVDFLASEDGQYYMLLLDSNNMDVESSDDYVGGDEYTYQLTAEVGQLETTDLGALPVELADQVLDPGGTCNYYTFDAAGDLLLNIEIVLPGQEADDNGDDDGNGNGENGENGENGDGGDNGETDGGVDDGDDDSDGGIDGDDDDDEEEGEDEDEDEAGSAFDPYLVIYNPETFEVLAGGAPESIDNFFTTNTQYMVAVCDNYGAGGEDYLYDLVITEEAPPQGNTCEDPLSLTLPPAGDQIVIEGSTAKYDDSYEGLCCSEWGSAGNDVVYALQVEEDTTVEISVTSQAFDTILYLRNKCADNLEITEADEPFCHDDISESNYNSVITGTLTPGSWYLHVDGVFEGQAGAYTLTVSVADET